MTKNSLLQLSQHHATTTTFPCKIPEDVAAMLIAHRSTMQSACALLKEQMTNLEQDWEPRSETFWLTVLSCLHRVRTALAPALALAQQKRDVSLMEENLYHFLLNLGYADGLVDKAGITVTAYLPLCDSRTEPNLRKRLAVIAVLRELLQAVQEVVEALDIEDKNGRGES